MKSLTIGLAAGINPSVALALKAELIGVGARNDVRVNVVTSEIEMRKDAPDARIGLGDRKIAALESVIELERAGCDEVVVPDVRSEPFFDEVQTEVEVPMVSLYRGLPAALEAAGVRRIGLLGIAVDREFFVKLLDGTAEVLELSDELKALYRTVQDPETGLRRKGLTPEHKAALLKAGHALLEGGADLLVTACGQMARFVSDLKAEGLPVFDLLRDTAERPVLAPLARRPKPFKVGMIGGLGPAATVDLYDKIVKATPARNDQEHFKVAVEQNPQIADRTACLLGNGTDPTLAMFNCARRLQEDGCDMLIVPCNTAHAFVPYLERNLRIPFINMQQVTMEEIREKFGDAARIGLLATTGTVKTGIYGKKAEAMNLPMFTPDEAHQERVMAAIYGPKGAKAGYTDGICREDLVSAVEYLVTTYDCNCLILGCTELPLILDETDDFRVAGKTVSLIDPTSALARRVVKEAQKAEAERGVR